MAVLNQIIHERISLWAVIAVTLLCLCISEISIHFVDGATSSTSHRNSISGASISDGTQSQRKPWIGSVNNLRSSSARNSSKVLTGALKSSQDKRFDVLNEIGASSKGGKRISKSYDGEKVPHDETPNAIIESTRDKAHGVETYEDIETNLKQFINSKPDLNNMDVITQAFRFVKLDSHLHALVTQLSKLQESHEMLQIQTVKQETKFEVVLDQVRALANSVSGESVKIKEVEHRIESEIQKLNHRLGEAVEKIIKSSATSHIMLDLSKESIQQMSKVEGMSDELLKEVKSMKSELGDVGQVSVQAIYNIHKLEESLMAGLAEMGNRTFYAMRHKIIEPTVLLENGSEGNSIQADGTNSDGGSVKKLPGQTLTSGGSKTESLVPCLSQRLINGKPRDCGDIKLLMGHSQSGVYQIFPFTKDPDLVTEVFCEMETKGGGWTVIQRRNQGPRENFYRTWQDYEKGFGSPYNQYWAGLINIAKMTESGNQELRIELTDWDGTLREANYFFFRVSNGTDKYRLHIADFTGSAGDSLSYHNGMAFSTKDQDNDPDKSVHCAQRYQGAWWYKNCHQSNLNGMYVENKGNQEYAMGINWYSWHGYYYSLKTVELKIRNRNFSQ